MGSIGDVEIQENQRIPRSQQRQQGAHLGRVGLHPVPVEVEVAGGGAPAGLPGAVLVGAMVWPGVLVPVHVEDRDEDEGGVPEEAGERRSLQQLTKEEKAGVLAVDLPRVNAGQSEDHRPSARPCPLRGERAVGTGREDPQGASLEGGSELRDLDLARKVEREVASERVDLVGTAGLGVVGSLGLGGERRGRRDGQQRPGDEGEHRDCQHGPAAPSTLRDFRTTTARAGALPRAARARPCRAGRLRSR